MSDGGVIRTNISVPKALKARMDQVEERVNWSAVAQAAFEAKLLELESKKETETMQDVIARMKAADELDNKESYQEGVKAGKRWASDQARPRHLRALDEAVEDGASDLVEGFCNRHGYYIGAGLYRCILRDPEADEGDIEAFWANALGEDSTKIEDNYFGEGFVEGALSVWDAVKGQI